MPTDLGKIIITSPDEPERIFIIETPIVRVGRLPAPQNDLVLEHAWVSRAHLRIYCDRQPYRVQDMRSSNGSALNDVSLPADEIRPLQDGDVIAIGPFRLKLVMPATVPADEEEAPPDAAQAEVERALEGLRLQPAPRTPAGPPAEPPTALGPDEMPTERWVGIPDKSSRWLQYLPPIYAQDPFIGRFLLLFEDMLGPLEQIINHFDLFLDPAVAPASFLPWINDWLAEVYDERWPEDVKRAVLKQASWLYQMRGTRAGLHYQLELCTGCEVEIAENVDGPHSFRVRVQQGEQPVDMRLVERIIELNRPAHTRYQIELT